MSLNSTSRLLKGTASSAASRKIDPLSQTLTAAPKKYVLLSHCELICFRTTSTSTAAASKKLPAWDLKGRVEAMERDHFSLKDQLTNHQQEVANLRDKLQTKEQEGAFYFVENFLIPV
jgi:hypothetical protein